MAHVTHLSIWAIPEVVNLPTPEVEALQVLADLVPFVSVPLRDLTTYEPRLRDWCLREDLWMRMHDFEAWTALGARLGLLRWPERDTILSHVHALRRASLNGVALSPTLNRVRLDTPSLPQETPSWTTASA